MLKNYVIVKHFTDSGKYLFRVPKSISLEAGDNVVCDTSRGPNQFGVCCCDSFLANPDVIMPLFGTCEKSMKWVTGKVEYEKFTEAQEEEDDEDGQQDEWGTV